MLAWQPLLQFRVWSDEWLMTTSIDVSSLHVILEASLVLSTGQAPRRPRWLNLSDVSLYVSNRRSCLLCTSHVARDLLQERVHTGGMHVLFYLPALCPG